MDTLVAELPPELAGFLLALALGLLIGIEREEHRPKGPGGIRTFPLLAIIGFLLTKAFPLTPLPFAVGLATLGALLAICHWHTSRLGEPGLTTEAAALLTVVLGACAAREMYWIAIAAGVIAALLLQEKTSLEGLASRLPREELRTLIRFLLISGVILPAVPDQSFTTFEINPFTAWLVVVAVCGVSYGSYLLQRWVGEGRGLLLSGILGGAYSSTATTVVLARRSKLQPAAHGAFAGGIVVATGVMYIRLWILLRLFAPTLAATLTVTFAVMAAAALVTGAVLSRRRPTAAADGSQADPARAVGNPLELRPALTFAGIFLAILVVTKLVADRFGGVGVLVMAAIMGAADVDPFILGLTQTAGAGIALDTAALAIVIAAATNNLMKGVYATVFGDRRTGLLSLALLTSLGVASIALFLVVR